MTGLTLTFAIAVAIVGCSSETYDPLGVFTSDNDLSGLWIGIAPNGATYWDDAADPNCNYEANLVLELQQTGVELSGTLQITIRDYSGPMNVPPTPCTDVGTVTTQSLSGTRTATQLNFTLEDGATEFSATCAPDVLSGAFAAAGGGPSGTWKVVR